MDLENQINDVLTRGVEVFTDPDGKFKANLIKKIEGKYDKDIIIKIGVDLTRPHLHLGHAVILRKLRAFQDLGCRVVFLVGDYTTQIGDPTGKSKVRPEIEMEVIEENMKTYLDQVGKILIINKKSFSWIRNSDWFTAITDLGFPSGHKVKLSMKQGEKDIDISYEANSFTGKAAIFEETRMQKKEFPTKKISVITLKGFLWTLRRITHSRLIQRDMFQERIKNGEELYMHEMMYPVLQGIDSQIIAQIYGSCDMEIGGTDQTFNMLVGRDVMKANKTEPQAVMSLELLVGTDGKEKMSKSLDNYIGITESARDIYGKIMSVTDTLIPKYFELATYTPTEEIADMEKQMENGKVNPKSIKMRLAREITAMYHGEVKAKEAEEEFENIFKKGGVPEEVKEISVEKGQLLEDVLLKEDIVSSKTDFRRLKKTGPYL